MAEYLTFEEVAATLKCSMGKVRQYVLEDRRLVATRLTQLGMALEPSDIGGSSPYGLDLHCHVDEDGTITSDINSSDGRPSVKNLHVGFLRIERTALDAFKLQGGMQGRMRLEAPDWGLWSQMPEAELWQAVVLSMDASPDDSESTFDWIFGSDGGQNTEEAAFLKECRRRMRIAEANAMFNRTGPIEVIHMHDHLGRDPRNTIALPGFGSWAEALEWSVPIQFPRVPNKASTPAEAISDKPLTVNERNGLLAIIGVLLELIQTPMTGRNNEAAVIAEMVDNYGEKHGISKRNLEGKFAAAKKVLE